MGLQWVCGRSLTSTKKEPSNTNLTTQIITLRSIRGYKVSSYSSNTSSNSPDPKRIESSINIVPDQSRPDRDQILLSVVLNFREFLEADMDAGGRRESGVGLMTTTLDL